MTFYFDTFTSPVGEVIVVQDKQGVRYVDFQDGPKPLPIRAEWQRNPAFCRQAREQLQAYFAGDLTQFELPLAPIGTDFQQRVWHVLAEVPYGHTCSYGDMAQRLNQPTAARAVGMANGRNPISIILPCHRVVGSNRKLTGYRGGLPIKTFLLTLEGFSIDNQQINTEQPINPG